MAFVDSTSAPPSVPGLDSQTFERITRWDLDKTYLRSEFYTFADLLRAAVERPDQKRPVPGAALLLRELASGPVRVHVVSGSPRQLRSAIVQRLAMDDVRPHQLTLKPNLQNLVRLRLAALKDQLGYKLTALLEAKSTELQSGIGPGLPELLFGDDSEADAFVYSLYADICTGVIDRQELDRILEAGHTYKDLQRRASDAGDRVRGSAGPRDFLILIHLDRQSPPSRFAGFGRRLVPFFNYSQAGLVLLERGHLGVSATYRLGMEMLQQHRFELDALARSYWDLHRRGFISERAIELLEAGRAQAPTPIAGWSGAIREADLRGSPAVPQHPPQPVNYQALARAHRGGADRQ